MSQKWARMAVQTYRWVGVATYPLIGSYVAVRASRGKEQHARRRERYGKASIDRPSGPLVWLHAVSVGETSAVLGLIERLIASGIHVVLTTGTTTSAALVKERMGDKVIHQYVPLDLKPAVANFLNYWQPDAAIFAESEIWPMTILELKARSIPQILINGRMSDRSFVRWQKRLALAETLFENFHHVAAQTERDAERFRQLGARPVTVTGNLKADVKIPAVDDKTKVALERTVAGRQVWAAISTHPGEEQIAARVHIFLKTKFPNLLTIIVPRHTRRTAEIYKMLTDMQLSVTMRSSGTMPAPKTDIFLGDSIGEMGIYLRMTDIAFVGKSLTSEGGQNPLEPAVLNTAILSGPNVSAFDEAYQKLIDAKAARFVESEKELVKSVYALLKNEKIRAKMAVNAKNVVGEMSGALDDTWEMLEPYIYPLIVKAQLGLSHSEQTADGLIVDNDIESARIGWK